MNRRDVLKRSVPAVLGIMGLASVRNAYGKSGSNFFAELPTESNPISENERQGVSRLQEMSIEELKAEEDRLRNHLYAPTRLNIPYNGFTDTDGFRFSMFQHRTDYDKLTLRLVVIYPNQDLLTQSARVPMGITSQIELDQFVEDKFSAWVNAVYFASTYNIYFPRTALGNGQWEWNKEKQSDEVATLFAFLAGGHRFLASSVS